MIIQILLYALIPTILIELAVLLLLRERSARILAASVVINILTNVPLNLFIEYYPVGLLSVLLCEILVILVETLWYYLFIRNLKRSFVYSFLCNAISFLTGLLVLLLLLFFRNI